MLLRDTNSGSSPGNSLAAVHRTNYRGAHSDRAIVRHFCHTSVDHRHGVGLGSLDAGEVGGSAGLAGKQTSGDASPRDANGATGAGYRFNGTTLADAPPPLAIMSDRRAPTCAVAAFSGSAARWA